MGEPIGATILGVLIFPLTQTPELITILFALIILAGIVLTSVSQYIRIKRFRRKKKKEDESDSILS